jgi:hypothetical protein
MGIGAGAHRHVIAQLRAMVFHASAESVMPRAWAACAIVP